MTIADPIRMLYHLPGTCVNRKMPNTGDVAVKRPSYIEYLPLEGFPPEYEDTQKAGVVVSLEVSS